MFNDGYGGRGGAGVVVNFSHPCSHHEQASNSPIIKKTKTSNYRHLSWKFKILVVDFSAVAWVVGRNFNGVNRGDDELTFLVLSHCSLSQKVRSIIS